MSEPSPAAEKELRAFGSCQHFANRLSPAFTRTRRAPGDSRGKTAGQRPGAGFWPLSQGGDTGSNPVGAAREKRRSAQWARCSDWICQENCRQEVRVISERGDCWSVVVVKAPSDQLTGARRQLSGSRATERKAVRLERQLWLEAGGGVVVCRRGGRPARRDVGIAVERCRLPSRNGDSRAGDHDRRRRRPSASHDQDEENRTVAVSPVTLGHLRAHRERLEAIVSELGGCAAGVDPDRLIFSGGTGSRVPRSTASRGGLTRPADGFADSRKRLGYATK